MGNKDNKVITLNIPTPPAMGPKIVIPPAPPAAPTATTMSTEDILAFVTSGMYSYHSSLEDALTSDKPNQIITGYDGLYIRRKEVFNGNSIIIVDKADKAPGLKNPPKSIECTIENKIPGKLFKEMVAWFRAVYDKHKTESAAQIYRSKETGEYFVYYPKQKVLAANVDYKDDLDAAVNLRQTNTLVLEAHSHPWGNTPGGKSWFSGGDDANEKFACFYLVVGSVMATEVSYGARMKLMDLQQAMTLEEMFDFTGIDAPLSTADIPAVNPILFTKLTVTTYKPYVPPATKPHTPMTEAERQAILARGRAYQNLHKDTRYDDHGFPIPDSLRGDAYGRSFSNRSSTYSYGKAYDGLSSGHSSLVDQDALSILNTSRQIDFEWLIDMMTFEETIALAELLADKLEGGKK